MKKTIMVMTVVVLLFLSSLVLYYCVFSNNKSMSTSTRKAEKTQKQLAPDILDEWDGVNVGPRPSGFVEPTVNEVDSIPTN